MRTMRMKEVYFKHRREWKRRHGKFSAETFQMGASEELLTDTFNLLTLLGEYRASLKRNLQSRKYQQGYRKKNREKLRVYHRDWKREWRSTKVQVL